MKKLATILVLLFITGCGINSTVKKADYVGNNKLYFTLNKADDKFLVSKISSASAPFGDYLLNDLSPKFDLSEQDCGVWFYGKPSKKNDKNCDYLEEHFRFTKVDKGKSALGTLLTAGIFSILGIHERYSYFDADKHWDGINSALVNSNIDRVVIFKYYDSFTTRTAKTNKEIMQLPNSDYIKKIIPEVTAKPDMFRSDMNSFLLKADSYIVAANNYDNFLTSFARKVNDVDSLSTKYKEGLERTSIKISVDDKSGFYDNSIDFERFFKIKATPIESFHYTPVTLSLSASDYKSFSDNVELKLQRHSESLRKVTTSYLVTVNSPENNSCYNYKLDYPETVDFSEGDIRVKAKAIVASKDFKNVIPSYENKDSVIDVKLSGNQISIKNKSPEFVRVVSIGYYYDNKLYTDSSSEIDGLEIAPESTSTLIVPSQVYSIIPDMTRMTSSKAHNQSINFGLALKYKVVNQNIDKSLYKKSEYNLYNILKARNFSCT